jgi:hypothetical protein
MVWMGNLVCAEGIVIPGKTRLQILPPASGTDIGPRPSLNVPVIEPRQSIYRGNAAGGLPKARPPDFLDIGVLLSIDSVCQYGAGKDELGGEPAGQVSHSVYLRACNVLA